MTRESPLRAQPDNRILAHSGNQYQGNLFDESQNSQDDHDQLVADYRQRYGLAEDPFGDDYSFPFFTGAGRRELLDRLLHLCQFSNSLIVVSGEYGVGKTRLAHALMDALPEDNGVSYLPVKANEGTEELLGAIVEDLELAFEGESSRATLLRTLNEFMQVDPLEDEALAVVVIDNAHLLQQDFLQAIAQLLQKNPKQNRLHIVLLGEPSLMDQLENCDLEGVLLNDFSLQPFSLGESVDYLNFRMEMADYLGPEIFTESMVNPWWRQAQGQLNVLHELAQERLLESVVAPVSGMPKRGLPVIHVVAIAVLITVVGVLFLYMGDDSGQSAVKPKIIATSPVTSTPNLTSTSTPVEPLMQTLPNASDTATQTATQASIAVEEERIVPLAEISSRPAVNQPAQAQPAQVAATTISAQPARPSVVAAIPPEVREEPKPITEPVTPKPVAVEKPIAPTSTKTSQEQTILGWPGSHHTIQLIGVSTEKAARDYVAAQSNKKDLLIFKSKRQGKNWFVVITGHYPNVAQARQAISGLPATQRNAGPWPRELKVIQQEIKSVP